jgi:hypothetical protein
VGIPAYVILGQAEVLKPCVLRNAVTKPSLRGRTKRIDCFSFVSLNFLCVPAEIAHLRRKKCHFAHLAFGSYIYPAVFVFWVTIWMLQNKICVISGIRRDVDEISALLGCYTAWSVPTFRDNSVPSSIGSPETWLQNYHSTLRNTPEDCRFQKFRLSL